jgi:hypothetical protein
MPEKFYNDVLSRTEFIDGFVHTITSDMLDQSEFWSEDQEEFLEKFKACANTRDGREFILFLVGYDKMSTYLEYLANTLGMNSDVEEEEDD